MTPWPTLNIKRKKSWSPSSPQRIPNSGFLFSLKSSSLIMDWFWKTVYIHYGLLSRNPIKSLAKNTCQEIKNGIFFSLPSITPTINNTCQEIKNGIFFSPTSNSNQRTYYRYVFLQSIWNPYRIFSSNHQERFSSNHQERCSRNTFRKSIFGLWLIRSRLIFSLQ